MPFGVRKPVLWTVRFLPLAETLMTAPGRACEVY